MHNFEFYYALFILHYAFIIMVTKSQIISQLKTVMDPELNISLYDLGLIYGITIGKKGNVGITMTLTSIGCPLFSTMEDAIRETLMRLQGVKTVTIDLTFEPPWTMDRMSDDAKAQLGFL